MKQNKILKKQSFEKALKNHKYTVHNNGYHWRLNGIDIYPTTGKWMKDGQVWQGSPNELLEFLAQQNTDHIAEIINTQTNESVLINCLDDLHDFIAEPFILIPR